MSSNIGSVLHGIIPAKVTVPVIPVVLLANGFINAGYERTFNCGGWEEINPLLQGLVVLGHLGHVSEMWSTSYWMTMFTPSLCTRHVVCEALSIYSRVWSCPYCDIFISCLLSKILFIDNPRWPLELLAAFWNEGCVPQQIRHSLCVLYSHHYCIDGKALHPSG